MAGSVGWNLWHGCHPFSEGCRHCYVFRIDARHGRDSTQVYKTGDYDLPLRRDRAGWWKVPPGTLVYTCFTSDFFVEEADNWREEAWRMMRIRSDLRFFLITKRIVRLPDCIPTDWGTGYENVTICCTMENQRCAEERIPLYRAAPIRHKGIMCEPLLGPIDFGDTLGPWAGQVSVGGESGNETRVCDFDWVLKIRQQCVEKGVPFTFRQTGARLRKDGRVYAIPRKYQHRQARRADIDYAGGDI